MKCIVTLICMVFALQGFSQTSTAVKVDSVAVLRKQVDSLKKVIVSMESKAKVLKKEKTNLMTYGEAILRLNLYGSPVQTSSKDRPRTVQPHEMQGPYKP